MDSPSAKAHPDDTSVLKRGPQTIGRGGLNPKIHLVAADFKQAPRSSLSPGQRDGAPAKRALRRGLGIDNLQAPSLVDCAHEGNETRWRSSRTVLVIAGFDDR